MRYFKLVLFHGRVRDPEKLKTEMVASLQESFNFIEFMTGPLYQMNSYYMVLTLKVVKNLLLPVSHVVKH